MDGERKMNYSELKKKSSNRQNKTGVNGIQNLLEGRTPDVDEDDDASP